MADDKKQETPKMSEKVAKIIEQIEKLSVLELAELVKNLEEKFGVSAAMAVAAPAVAQTSAAPSAGGQPTVEAKTEVNLILTNAGANKIAVIKAVREINPNLGLKEAKDLVEAAPKEVLTGVKPEEADAAKKKLEEAGAQAEIK